MEAENPSDNDRFLLHPGRSHFNEQTARSKLPMSQKRNLYNHASLEWCRILPKEVNNISGYLRQSQIL
jgi:hypothetical protein